MKPKVHLSPGLKLFWLLVLEVSETVIVPQLIRILDEDLKQIHVLAEIHYDTFAPLSLSTGGTGIPQQAR